MSDGLARWENYGDVDFAAYGGCLVRGDEDDPMCFDVLLLATPFDTGTEDLYVGCLARVDVSCIPDGIASVVAAELGVHFGASDAEGRLAGVDRGLLAAELVNAGDNPCIQGYETFRDGLAFTGSLGPEPMTAADARGLMEWAGVDPGLMPGVPDHVSDDPEER